MKCKSTSKALFGGALFTAGIVNAAQAQWTLHSDGENFSAISAISTVGYGDLISRSYEFEKHFQEIDWDLLNHPDIGGTASAYIGTHAISATLNSTLGTSGLLGQSDSFVRIDVDIVPSVDSTVAAAWDFTGYGPDARGFITLVDVTNSYNYILDLESSSDLGAVGSVSVELEVGNRYYVMLGVGGVTDVSMFASFGKVPAPGVLTLLGVAGFIGCQRRRRRY